MKVTAEEVKALRERLDWSTYRLADEVGCNQSTICRIENNKVRVRGALDKALCQLVAKHLPDRAAA